MDRFWREILVSIALHIIVWSVLSLVPSPPPVSTPLTFDVIPSRPQRAKKTSQSEKADAVVRNSQILPENRTDSTDDPTKFLSEQTQRVKQQTRAALSGLTANRSQKAEPSSKEKGKSEAKDTESKKSAQSQIQDQDGLQRFFPRKIRFPDPKMAQQESEKRGDPSSQQSRVQQQFTDLGQSTLAEDVQNVKVGDVTALNTDRYLYYSYFARAQELLWNEWSPHVQALMDRPPASMIGGLQHRFTTTLEVWFYPNGNVHSTHIMKPSGVPELDRLAELSFQRVRVIPNPPREKIEADGLIHFQWGLTVEYDPKVLVRH
jgi:TonB family protein